MMLRVLVIYKDQESLPFTVTESLSFEEVEQRFSGPSPITFRTSEGSRRVREENMASVLVQEIVDGKLGEQKAFVPKEDMKMGDEEGTFGQTNEGPITPTSEQTATALADMEAKKVLEPEVMPPMTGPNTGAVIPTNELNLIYRAHRDFKNQWIGVSTSIADHRKQIIGKMQKLEKMHEEVNGVLDVEIDNFSQFRKEQLNIVGK